MSTITIERRFCGPPNSANGGYFSGSVAALVGLTVAVRLLKPPPLEVALAVHEQQDGVLELRCGADLIAQTRLEKLNAPQLVPPSYLEAIEASRHYAGFHQHPFPTCFVCGPRRQRGDGLRIFPGAVGQRDLVAAPWVADESLDAGDGKVRPEFMWAALDCPGWLATVRDARMALLGEMAAHIDRRVHAGEHCVVAGWEHAASGRRHEAGTALFDEDGELCAYARATWIEPRPAEVAAFLHDAG
ncbi:MAG TPA: hypothetical protein VMG11_04195 [Steroidobacteraceae bacterium]|nr:hypothetical protein [Steroidobacteraceae bacterium]